MSTRTLVIACALAFVAVIALATFDGWQELQASEYCERVGYSSGHPEADPDC